MRCSKEKGLTLVELIVSITILALIGTATVPLLSTCLEAHSQGLARSTLHQEGLLIMERITSGVRSSTYLLIPNGHRPTRDILAFSGSINEDNDFFFNDHLFPRIDEDPFDDIDGDGSTGIANIDDNGDGFVDGSHLRDDDEDWLKDEDLLNGTDDDGDGTIDEDLNADIYNNNVSGIFLVDDNGNGIVDESSPSDDDEDGAIDEDSLNPLIYVWNTETCTLTEKCPYSGTIVDLSTHVTRFQATYEAPDTTHAPRVLISLTLTGDDGKRIQYNEYVYPRNVLQKTGKRVR